MARKKILFIGEGASLSHVVRPMYLARVLDQSQYEISFASAPWYKEIVEKAGFTYHPLLSMTREEFVKRLANGEPLYNTRRLNEYITAEMQLIDQVRPDLIISDFRISLSVSAVKKNIPFGTINNAYWSPYSLTPKVLPDLPMTQIVGFKASQLLFKMFYGISELMHVKDFNQVRRRYGLPAVKTLEEMYTPGTWVFYVDTPGLIPTRPLPDNHMYLGPVMDMPDLPKPDWWKKWPNDKPLIYLSLGSTGNLGVLDALIESLSLLDVSVLLATAGRIKRERWPANFYCSNFISGVDAASVVNLFICNGGSGSTYQALAQGVPVLAFPSNMDQYLCSTNVVLQGAGKIIRREEAKPGRISQDIKALIASASYAQQAKRLANEIQQYRSEYLFRNFIEKWDKACRSLRHARH